MFTHLFANCHSVLLKQTDVEQKRRKKQQIESAVSPLSESRSAEARSDKSRCGLLRRQSVYSATIQLHAGFEAEGWSHWEVPTRQKM